MNKKLKNILQYGFFLALGIFLSVWQYNQMTADEKKFFAQSIRECNYWVVLPVFLMSVLSHLSRAARWRILIEPLGKKPHLSTSFATVMIGYLVNTFVPRVGEVAKCTLLGKREKIPVDKLIGTILVERTVDLFSYFIIILITVALQFERVETLVVEIFSGGKDSAGKMNPFMKLGIFIGTCIAVALLFRFIFRRFSHNRIVQKMKGIANGLRDGFSTIKKINHKGWFIAHTIFIWLMYLLQIQVGFLALEYTSHLGLDAAFATLTLGTLAMIITPGGMGAFPIAVAKVLVLFNITQIMAQSFGWIMWGASTGIVIIVGLICYIWYEIQTHRRHAQRTPLHTT
jgi:glycosyltransferase 2 family protein